jgi:phosphoribosylformylglycinamidine (FGAM) synthase-like enzyme
MEPTVDTAKNLGLTADEFEKIKQIWGAPNFTELSIFSVMWSEHCSYKNSILQLKTLPRRQTSARGRRRRKCRTGGHRR